LAEDWENSELNHQTQQVCLSPQFCDLPVFKVHDCLSCGLKIDRDLNAAKNILTILGLRGRAYGDLTSGLNARSGKRQIVEVGSSGL